MNEVLELVRHPGIPCKDCDGHAAELDSRPLENAIRRRRICLDCHVRFTTYEYREEDLGDMRKVLKMVEAIQAVVNE